MYTKLDYMVDCSNRLLEREIQIARNEILFSDGKVQERMERNYRNLCVSNDIQRRIVNVKYTGLEG